MSGLMDSVISYTILWRFCLLFGSLYKIVDYIHNSYREDQEKYRSFSNGEEIN